MKTIAIASQKGGVGKTTTALELYDCLKVAGKSCLFIDLDQQCNATSTLANFPDNCNTIYDVLKKNCVAKQALQGDIIPGNPLLASIEYELSSVIGGALRLKQALAGLDYDYCIIDTPPNLGIYLISALIAATDVIIPVKADVFSIEGLSNILTTVNEVKENFNQSLNIMGILLTNYDQRRELDRKIWNTLHYTKIDYPVFNTKVRVCQDITKSWNSKQLLSEYNPKCKAYEDYSKLVKEII